MKRYIFYNTLFLAHSLISFCQTSVVQDGKGETSLNWGESGVVAINTKAESLSFSAGLLIGDQTTLKSRNLIFFGIKATGKAKNSLSSIIKSDNFQYDGSFGFFVSTTKTYMSGPLNRTDHFFIGADYINSRFKVFDKSAVFSKQISDEAPGASRFTLGYNEENSYKSFFSYILGIAANWGQRNNTEELKTVGVSTVSNITDPVSGQVRSVEQDLVSAYEVNKYKNSLSYFNLNADFGPQFGNRFLFLIHPRYSVFQDRKPQFNPAVGLYLTKLNAPLEVVAGIQLQVQDWFDTGGNSQSRSKRSSLNLVAGYSF